MSESYRLWLQYETRTDDITIIAVHLDTEALVSEGEGSAYPCFQMRSAHACLLFSHNLVPAFLQKALIH